MIRLTADVLRSYGFTPDIIVDVGVYEGTPWLYDAYPDIPTILVDPQGIAPLKRHPGHLKAAYSVFAGARKGRAGVNMKGASTHAIPGDHVRVERLEDLLAEHPGTIGLKVDAEGMDADVMWGLVKRRKDVAFLVCEVARKAMWGRNVNAGLFMAMYPDFHLYEWFAPDHPADTYRNALFVPTGSPLLSMP